jgi:hypothetical protein
MTRALSVLLALLVLTGSASAQRAYAPNRVEVVEDTAARCPGLILQDHTFTDAVASRLYREDARWGRNGKRGNVNDPSHDAIAYRTDASPFGVAVVDIIGAAGSADARPAWIDQTDATIAAGTTGVWVAPSGVLPPCLSGGPVPPVVGPPPPSADLSAVLAALARIEERLTALERRPSPDLALLTRYVEDMIGAGPEGGTGPHITDIQQRLDVLRVTLEQLDAWLRSRSVLRYR